MRKDNYRGVKPATLVKVLEGNGTPESPYQEVDYVVVFERVGGLDRQTTIGKVEKLPSDFFLPSISN